MCLVACRGPVDQWALPTLAPLFRIPPRIRAPEAHKDDCTSVPQVEIRPQHPYQQRAHAGTRTWVAGVKSMHPTVRGGKNLLEMPSVNCLSSPPHGANVAQWCNGQLPYLFPRFEPGSGCLHLRRNRSVEQLSPLGQIRAQHAYWQCAHHGTRNWIAGITSMHTTVRL